MLSPASSEIVVTVANAGEPPGNSATKATLSALVIPLAETLRGEAVSGTVEVV
jgi:hypothetical protein